MDVNGFEGIDGIASGDDMLLMHKIFTRYPDNIAYLKSTNAIVQTKPVKSVGQFLNQRIRWASKADKYDDKRIFAVLFLVYVVNVLLLVLPFAGIFIRSPFHISLYPFTMVFTVSELWIFLLIIKTIAELIFLMPVSKFFGQRKLLWLFPLMQPFHIVYTVIAGWLGKFGSYSWKERKVK